MGLIGPGWIDYICPSRGVGQHFAGQLFTSRSAELARCLTRLPDILTDEPHHCSSGTVPRVERDFASFLSDKGYRAGRKRIYKLELGRWHHGVALRASADPQMSFCPNDERKRKYNSSWD